ncbi:MULTISPECIES: transporter substrate-binding domain-containing protein [Psychrobacter]|nr:MULTISPECIES: transporter substrate-binding domain-containing protein [Psychrobacter]MBF4490260.1 transporter substrate-binding domain-containing protein [Psychrobacter sp. N25K4-3-2]MBP3946494.1 transporter substrate-binding domain-containing protein [Psychrobacter sp. K31L]
MMSNSRLLWSSMTVTAALMLSACSQPADETAGANADAPAAETAGKTIRIATEGAYPPFNYTNADGTLAGFDIDVANALCDQMQAKCEIVAQDWDGIIPGLLAQKYDAVVAGMSITAERQEKVDFSEPYFANTMVWLTDTKGSFDPTSIKSLTLGGQRSTTPGAYLQDNYEGKDGNTVKLYDNYDNAYLDLKSGRSDAVLAEKVSAKSWLADNPEGFGVVGDEIDNDDNIAIAVRKDDPLRDDFNKALSEIRSNGELARLEQINFGQ